MASKPLMRPSRAIEYAWEEVTASLRVPKGSPQRTFGWIATGYPTPPKRLTQLLTRYKEEAVPFEIDPSWVDHVPTTMVWSQEDATHMAWSLVQSIPLGALPLIQRAMLLCGPTRADTPDLQTLLLPEKKTEHEYLLHWWISDQHTILEMPARSGTWEQLFPPLPETALDPEPTPYQFPVVIPQPTFQEMREQIQAAADGPQQRHWLDIDGETALRHAVKGSPLETKLNGTPLLGWLGLPNDVENLRGVVQQLGLDAGILACIAIGAVLAQKHRAYCTTTLDTLIDKIGWQVRLASERESKRQKIWHWLLTFSSMQMIGCRPGKYKDRDGRVIDLTSRDPLLLITGTRYPEQQTFNGNIPPLEITFGVGAWLDVYRQDHRITTYLGDVCKIAAIPGGKPSGRWARSLGLALHQAWREQASAARPGHNGDDNTPTIRFKKRLTRRYLLGLFPPDPPVEDLLNRINPGRAKDYWREAIEFLKEQDVIGTYHEVTALADRRKGWEDDWLDQELDIRPPAVTMAAITEIAQSSQTAKKKARSARKPRAIASAS